MANLVTRNPLTMRENFHLFCCYIKHEKTSDKDLTQNNINFHTIILKYIVLNNLCNGANKTRHLYCFWRPNLLQIILNMHDNIKGKESLSIYSLMAVETKLVALMMLRLL